MGFIASLRNTVGSAVAAVSGGGEGAKSARSAALLEQAIPLHESGELDAAEALYRRVLQKQPRHAEALHLTGVLQHQRGDHVAALDCIEAAIRERPDVALFHFNRGNVLAALERREAAAAAFSETVRLNPQHSSALFNLGKSCMQMQQPEQAVPALRRAFELDPALPGLRFELAAALVVLGEKQASQACHREAVDLLRDHWPQAEAPNSARLLFAYGLHQLGAWTEAKSHYLDVLASQPTLEEEIKTHSNLANCYNQLGQMSEAVMHYRETLRLNPDFADTASSIASCVNYDPHGTPEQVIEAHRDWSRRFADGLHDPRRAWPHDRDPERRLRIGYVSPDFRRHPVTSLFAPILERHDRERFETFCYYNHPGSDEVTERVRGAAAHWRDVNALSDSELAQRIEADGIDILIDLAGHTAWNRLRMFARKPAPVLVEWLGYFNSTGIETFDYFLSDPHSSPPGQERWFSEKLLRLPETRFCYSPHAFMPEVGPLPALAHAGQVTFGCFNNLSKLNPAVLRLWSRILEALPSSRLVIQAHALDDPPNRARFARLAAECGISVARLELRPFVPLEEAAKAYLGIDIALDPFPFCGGMTSFEALWMGVPVVTRDAGLIAGRQTLSMLANLGLEELIARDDEAYVAIAVGLARDLERLSQVRAGLRPRFAASPLMDYPGFTRHLESSLRGMWHRWLADSAPRVSNGMSNAAQSPSVR